MIVLKFGLCACRLKKITSHLAACRQNSRSALAPMNAILEFATATVILVNKGSEPRSSVLVLFAAIDKERVQNVPV